MRDAVALLEPLERLDDLAHVARVARLRHHVAVGSRRERRLEVGAAERAPDRIHPHPALAATELAAPEPLRHDRPCRRLAVGRDRVLEVEDEAVGREREGLGEHPLVTARDEVERAPAAAHAVVFRIIAFRRATITTSPCWFRARCSNVTMPHCGRDFDSRLPTTWVSA